MNIFKIEGQNELHIVGTIKLLSDEELKEIALKNKVENFKTNIFEVFSHNRKDPSFKHFSYQLNY